MNGQGPNPWGNQNQTQQGLGGSFDGIDQEFVLWKTRGNSLSGQISWTEQPGERAAFRAGYETALRSTKK